MKYALLIIFLFLVPFASAGYISIQNDISVIVVGNQTIVHVNTSNFGDELAKNVYLKVQFSNITEKTNQFDLDVDSSFENEFKFDTFGTGTLIVTTFYSDLNYYPFSINEVKIIGNKNDLINIDIKELELSGKSNLKVLIKNYGGDVNGVLKLITSQNLDVISSSKNIFLKANSSNEFKFKIKKGTSLVGSNFPVFAYIEFNDNVAIGTGNIKIVKNNHVLLWLSLFILLGVFVFIAYKKSLFIKNNWEKITIILIFISIFIFLLTYFKPEYLFSLTTTTGGDTASHYFTAKVMRDSFLPHFTLFGWTHGNYAGFPLLQFYFPLPFLFMALFSYIIPLQIAFKIGTILGTFLLPISAYYFFNKINAKYPIIASLFTLPFLFIESNSMWGGNIPSTLAGEFSYSLALGLSFFYFGNLYSGIKKGKDFILNAFLLFLIGLSHVYILLFAGFSSLFFLFNYDNLKEVKKHFQKNLIYLLKLAGLAFLLLGFWIIPLISKIKFTTSYADSWVIKSLSVVFPLILIPFLLLIILFIPNLFFERKYDDKPLFLMFMILVSFFFYLFSVKIGLVDIRFLPFIQLVMLFLGALALSQFLSRIKKPYNIIVILLVALFTFGFVASNVKFTDQWIPWNYNGFEEKGSWDIYKAINNDLRGNFSDPRVVFEHSEKHNSMGSTRAFESLPLFANRATLEGLYMQSSPIAPFVFYIQSLVSKEKSCPFPNFGCSDINLKRAKKRLNMFNVGNLILISNISKLEADNIFEKRSNYSSYSLYNLKTQGYVSVPKYEPVFVKTNDSQLTSYLWFINDNSLDVPIVFDKRASKLESNSIESLPRKKINKTCIVNDKIEDNKISFKTNCVGEPHIIKFSYYPNWKVKGAKEIFMVSPSFMLVYPDSKEVEIYYGHTTSDYLGLFFTLFAIGLIVSIKLIKSKWDKKFDKFLLKNFKYLILVIIILLILFVLLLSVGKNTDSLRKDIALKTNSYSVCKFAGGLEENCYNNVAIKTNDSNLCYVKIKDNDLRDKCLFELKDRCDLIRNKELKEECKVLQ